MKGSLEFGRGLGVAGNWELQVVCGGFMAVLMGNIIDGDRSRLCFDITDGDGNRPGLKCFVEFVTRPACYTVVVCSCCPMGHVE